MLETLQTKANWQTKARWRLHASADWLVTTPLVRWTWNSSGVQGFPSALSEFRPADADTVREMMAGRYLFCGKLIDTHGTSPFGVAVQHANWAQELETFAWLRHFKDTNDKGERRFARTLTMDWIGRQKGYSKKQWRVGVTAQRVTNWLRHFGLLLDGASSDQSRTIRRMLARQLQSLRMRVGLSLEPYEQLLARIALFGGVLCDGSPGEIVGVRLEQLMRALAEQIDDDGLHRSRNPGLQVQLLMDLTTLRQALSSRQVAGHDRIEQMVDRMHSALDQLTLGTGELGYFNGGGQQQSDLVYALQSQSAAKRKSNTQLSGYGILSNNAARLVADSGKVPPLEYAAFAHAGAMSFEFSHGSELIVGNCGPAPAELRENADLFRLGAAHSAPVPAKTSAAALMRRGIFAGRLVARDEQPGLFIEHEDDCLRITCQAYREVFGIALERWLTLMADGESLVGQDRVTVLPGETFQPLVLTTRFHLGPGVTAVREQNEDIVRLTLPSGSHWSFLWEGAEVSVEDSVRQSAYYGLYRTRQIVLEETLTKDKEIAWILTRLD